MTREGIIKLWKQTYSYKVKTDDRAIGGIIRHPKITKLIIMREFEGEPVLVYDRKWVLKPRNDNPVWLVFHYITERYGI